MVNQKLIELGNLVKAEKDITGKAKFCFLRIHFPDASSYAIMKALGKSTGLMNYHHLVYVNSNSSKTENDIRKLEVKYYGN